MPWIAALLVVFALGGLGGVIVGPLWRWLKSKDPAA
jgi:hypothetical protein